MRLKFLLFWLGMLPFLAMAQQKTNQQVWLDYVADLPVKKNLYETEFSYQTVLSKENKWRSLNATPAYERNINQHLDLISGLGLSYTAQTDTTDTFETRIMLGTRLYLTPKRRIQTRVTARLERRHLYYFGEKDWQVSHRSRLRVEAVIPLNRKSYSEDKLWYAITDLEYFYVYDQNLDERFANRSRARLGIGYRHNYNFRYEAIFMRQRSRNEIEDGFLTSDQVLRIRIKHYLK